MTTAVIYARFSTELQSESSIADQFRVCREYAEANGWQVSAEFSDRGISGAALGNRPGAQAAIAATRDVLLVMDLSRLSRSQDLAPMLSRLRHRGARVIGVQDGYDSDSRTARMQAGLSGIMSEEFRAMIADRTRSALQMRAKAGQPTGGKAYDDPEIVREIFARFAAGESMKAIASDLNRRGIPSPGVDWKPRARPRGHWLVSTLHTLLRNERYIGRVIWNRSQWVKNPDTGRRARRERPASEWIVTDCAPLIDLDTWTRAQARFSVRVGKGGGKPSYLLSGLLECGACGSKLIVVGGSQRRYTCGTYHAGGEHACSNRVTFPRWIAEERILDHVQEEMLSPAAVAEGVKMLREERAKAEAPVKPADREVIELQRLVREGVLSAEVVAPALAEARRRSKARTTPVERPWPSDKVWRAAVENMRDVLRGEDVTAAREVLRELIGNVRCVPADGYVVAELTKRKVLLTGTGRSVYGMVAGACNVVCIPTSTRRRKWTLGS